MSKNNIYSDFKKKIDRIENHLAEEVAQQVNELFVESVRKSLINWYNDYDPTMYIRTKNFMKVLDSARTSGKKNILTFSVSSGSMSSYKGFDISPYKGYEKQSLQPSTAFDYMFTQGEHGHGYWMKHQSEPPYISVEKDIKSGFDGRLDKIINNKIEEILRK